MATHSNILAWEILWTEEPCRLQPWGHKRVGHDLTTKQKKKNKCSLNNELGKSGLFLHKPNLVYLGNAADYPSIAIPHFKNRAPRFVANPTHTQLKSTSLSVPGNKMWSHNYIWRKRVWMEVVSTVCITISLKAMPCVFTSPPDRKYWQKYGCNPGCVGDGRFEPFTSGCETEIHLVFFKPLCWEVFFVIAA